MLNKVILMGRLTADTELRMTPSGVEVVTFAIAVDRKFAKPGEQKKADFINCVAWRETAKFIHMHFGKGKMINVCGTLQTRTWDDAQGQKRYATEVIVDEVNFCGDGAKKDPLNDVVEAVNNMGFAPVDSDEDLPF